MLNPTTLELVGDREIVIHRRFAAPARIVFEAYTRADLVARWWAPNALGVEIVSTEADVRKGGRFRYVIRPRGGEPIGFNGEYREVTPHSRIVYSQVYEPMADLGEVVITVTLTEADGQTDVRFSELCPSVHVRDGIIASGMESGMRNTFDQLEELVITLAAT
ncbi:SRPBCC family protein [Asticcacaulis sp.]|uniref:SRPBCC family protein n=1 Tax=Asticcacaulis sp. TaxID=1872648 RepID=UPI0031E2CE9C